MHPIICQIGPVTIYSFGLLFLAALVICSSLLGREAKQCGITLEEVYDFSFWVIIGGLLGARIFFILLNLSFFLNNPAEIIMLNKGGLAWQGGFGLGLLVGIWYTRRLKISVLFMVDLVAPYLALGQAIGRIGCFLNGCCYGRPAAWGIYFPAHQDRLQPTQLYDVVALSLVFLALKGFSRVFKKQGQVFAMYLILAALERFVNEFFRGDHAETYFGLSVFQLVSVAIFFCGIALFLVLQIKSYAKLEKLARKAKTA